MTFCLRKNKEDYTSENAISVWDDVLPVSISEDLYRQILTSDEWSLSRTHQTPNNCGLLEWNGGAWGINIGGSGIPNDHPKNQIITFEQQEEKIWKKWPRVKILWDSVQKLCPQYDMKCSRCWALGTRSLGGDLHTDMVQKYFEDIPGITFIYYCVDEWKIEWDGATSVFRDDEILRSVLPKANRLIAFDPRLHHKAMAVSKHCNKLRSVITFHARITKEKINE